MSSENIIEQNVKKARLTVKHKSKVRDKDDNCKDNNDTNDINRKVKKNELIIIPTSDNYNAFLNNKFSITQLKSICKHYKLPVTGNKQVLTNVIYKYLYLSHNAVIIQKIWRKYYYKVYSKLRGPARFNRKLCVNETDFFTMDDLKDLPFKQFFSYKDKDNMIYGFDIMSLYNLINVNNVNNINNDFSNNNTKLPEVLNPYTRNPMCIKVIKDFKSLLFFSKLLKDDLQLNMNEPEIIKNNNGLTHENIVIRSINLFYDIDTLGNYTNPMWFLELQQPQLLVYFRELFDIWTYRAQLSEQVKLEICPQGSPFTVVQMTNMPLLELQHNILVIMETMVMSGINQSSRYLGSSYVLCALTLINRNAAETMPWLYESVSMPF